MTITKEQFVKIAKSKVAAQSTALLKEMAKDLMARYECGAGVAFVFVLDELERRMTTEEYEAFCETL